MKTRDSSLTQGSEEVLVGLRDDGENVQSEVRERKHLGMN